MKNDPLGILMLAGLIIFGVLWLNRTWTQTIKFVHAKECTVKCIQSSKAQLSECKEVCSRE